MHLQIVQLVSLIVAFALAGTRILTASKPFWGFAPPWLAGLLPSLLVALPALGQAVVGVKTGVDLTVALLIAGALLLPGVHSHTVALKPPSGPGSAGLGFVLAFALAFTLSACAGWKGVAKSVDQAAVILCDVFFSEQPKAVGLSSEEVEKAFCSTAEQVAPFLDSAQKAMGRGGAVRLGRSEE